MSDALEQLLRRTLGSSAEIFVASSDECATGASPLIAQHALPLAEQNGLYQGPSGHFKVYRSH